MPVMLLRLGSVPMVVVCSPEAAREVMRTHDAHCCSWPAMPGPRRLTYGYKDIAFAPYGDHVREMRKLFILELLSMRRVQAAWDAREAQVILHHSMTVSYQNLWQRLDQMLQCLKPSNTCC
jgi:4-hydroxyphenylacetaldehyde oxime monooxygenase